MDKPELLAAVRAAHAPIAAAAAALSDDALLVVPDDLDGWTRKDVLAHLEHWHRYATALVASAGTGVDPFPDAGDDDIDTENAAIQAANAGRSADDVRAGFAASFAELVAAIEAASDHDLFADDVQPWIEGATADEVMGDTAAHYAKHARHLGADFRYKPGLLAAVRASHGSVEAAVDELSDDDLLADAPGMTGWSRKDVLAHIEFWHDHSANVIIGIRSGANPYADWPTDTDPINDRVFAENRDRSAAEVREGEAASFERLIAAIEAATDAQLFDAGVVAWFSHTAFEMIAADTFDHYPEHVVHLAAD
jgi:hypothetical protein